jgi:hypothetical protein
MSTITISAREFNQDRGQAKKLALEGPVVITDHGRPSHVLLSYPTYKKILGHRGNIAEQLAMDEAANIAFEAPTLPDLPPASPFSP